MNRRILMTADTVGGVWTYAVELAAGLGRAGVEVHLATMGGPLSAEQWEQARAADVAGLRESRFRLEWMDDPWEDVAEAGSWLLSLEAELRPDVIHLNGYAHGVLPWLAPTVIVAHSCVVSWWWAVHGCPPPAAWDRYRLMVAEGLRAAHRVVAPTAAMAVELSRAYGFEGAVVVANGRSEQWRKSCPKERFILATGRVWDEAKNLGQLQEISPRLAWPVYIAGATDRPGSPRPDRHDGPSGQPTVSRPGPWHPAPDTAAGRAPGSPVLLGRLGFAELSEWLSRAGIFAAPARYEPFGLGILEAAQAEVPLVLGRAASLVELWEGAAVFVDPDDPQELAVRINALAADDTERHRLGGAARARSRKLSRDAMTSAYLNLYRSLRRPQTAEVGR